METLRPDTKMSHACKRSSHRGVGLSLIKFIKFIKFATIYKCNKNFYIYTESVNEMGRIARQVVSLTNPVDHFTKLIVKYKEIPGVVIVEKFPLGKMVLEIVHLHIYIHTVDRYIISRTYDTIM